MPSTLFIQIFWFWLSWIGISCVRFLRPEWKFSQRDRIDSKLSNEKLVKKASDCGRIGKPVQHHFVGHHHYRWCVKILSFFFFRSHITSPRHAESDTNISNGKKRFRQMKLAFFTRNHFAHGSTIFFFWCSPHFRVLIPLRILIFSHLDNINYTHDGRLWIFGSQIQNKTRRNIITSLNSLERLNWIAARWTMNHRHTMEIRTFRRMELTCAPFSISFASQFYSHSTW